MISRFGKPLRSAYHCWATVIPGLESLFQYELVKLNVGNKSTCVYHDYSGGVELQVNDEQFWKLLCCSRMVESARVRIGRFKLTNRRSFENSISQIPWSSYITKDDDITVNTTVIKNNMFFPRDINQIVMESGSLQNLAKSVSTERKANSKKIFFLIRRDNVTVSIDTGYQSNRGYRQFLAETPLKETIAAAMCYNSFQNAGRLKNNLLIFDLFCGSGVLCDEFNSIITHDYPYLQRRRLLKDYHHGFENWPCHNKNLFDKFISQLEQEKNQRPLIKDYALLNSDISNRAIFCAKQNTMNLFRSLPISDTNEVGEKIVLPEYFSFDQVAFEKRSQQILETLKASPDQYKQSLMILANPPIYMVKAGDFKELDKLYASLFQFLFDLKRMDYLKKGCILIPYSTQFRLPEQFTEIASLRQLKLGDHTLIMMSI